VDPELPPLPIGRTGRLEAASLTNAAGNHALLVRQDASPRALVTSEPSGGERERLVVVPLDEDAELRVDGDALAVWLAEGSMTGSHGPGVPAWANAVGYVLILLIVVFVVLGGATFFGWILDLVGAGR
jgi:hypothetical protein